MKKLFLIFVLTLSYQSLLAQSSEECSMENYVESDEKFDPELTSEHLEISGGTDEQLSEKFGNYSDLAEKFSSLDSNEGNAAGALATVDSDVESFSNKVINFSEKALENAIEEFPIADVMTGLGTEAQNIIDAISAPLDNTYEKAKLGVDLTIDTIDNFFPPATILLAPLESFINSYIEEAELEYKYRQHSKINTLYHQNAVTIEDVINKKMENFEKYLNNNLLRATDNDLATALVKHSNLVVSRLALSQSLDAAYNNRLKNAINLHLTPKSGDAIYQNESLDKPVFFNHYDVLKNVCKSKRIKTYSLNDDSRKYYLYKDWANCFLNETQSRVSELLNFFTHSSNDLKQYLHNVNNIRKDIYKEVYDNTDETDLSDITYQALNNNFNKNKSALLNSTQVAAVIKSLKAEYAQVTYWDNVAKIEAQAYTSKRLKFNNDYSDPKYSTCIDERQAGDSSSWSEYHTTWRCLEWSSWKSVKGDDLKVNLTKTDLGKNSFTKYTKVAANKEISIPFKNLISAKVIDNAVDYYYSLLNVYFNHSVKYFTVFEKDEHLLTGIKDFTKFAKKIDNSESAINSLDSTFSSSDDSDYKNSKPSDYYNNYNLVTYKLYLTEKIPSNIVMQAYSVLERLSEKSRKASCEDGDYDLTLSRHDLTHNGSCSGIAIHCRHIEIIKWNWKKYTYDSDKESCKLQFNVDYKYSNLGTIFSTTDHPTAYGKTFERTDSTLIPTVLPALQSLQLHQMKELEEYLGHFELLQELKPDLWDVSEAYLIHNAIMAYYFGYKSDTANYSYRFDNSSSNMDLRKLITDILYTAFKPVSEDNIDEYRRLALQGRFSNYVKGRKSFYPAFVELNDDIYFTNDIGSILYPQIQLGNYNGYGNRSISSNYYQSPLTNRQAFALFEGATNKSNITSKYLFKYIVLPNSLGNYNLHFNLIATALKNSGNNNPNIADHYLSNYKNTDSEKSSLMAGLSLDFNTAILPTADSKFTTVSADKYLEENRTPISLRDKLVTVQIFIDRFSKVLNAEFTSERDYQVALNSFKETINNQTQTLKNLNLDVRPLSDFGNLSFFNNSYKDLFKPTNNVSPLPLENTITIDRLFLSLSYVLREVLIDENNLKAGYKLPHFDVKDYMVTSHQYIVDDTGYHLNNAEDVYMLFHKNTGKFIHSKGRGSEMNLERYNNSKDSQFAIKTYYNGDVFKFESVTYSDSCMRAIPQYNQNINHVKLSDCGDNSEFSMRSLGDYAFEVYSYRFDNYGTNRYNLTTNEYNELLFNKNNRYSNEFYVFKLVNTLDEIALNSSKKYAIFAMHSQLALTADNKDNNRIIQTYFQAYPNQLLSIKANTVFRNRGAQLFSIVVNDSNSCIGLKEDKYKFKRRANFVQEKCFSSRNIKSNLDQLFFLNQWSAEPSVFQIKNLQTSMCMDINYISTNSGAYDIQWRCHRSDTYLQNQKFLVLELIETL